MAASGVIQRGIVVVADGSFLEISPPVLTLPETLHVGYRTANSIVSRIVVSTRPNNLTAYWPMDEGSGVLVEDSLVEMMVPWSVEQVGRMASLAKQFALMGHPVLFRPKLPVLNLALMGRNRGQLVWTFVEDGNPRSEPGFYGYGERVVPAKTDIGDCVTLKMGDTPSFCRSIGVGIREHIIITT